MQKVLIGYFFIIQAFLFSMKANTQDSTYDRIGFSSLFSVSSIEKNEKDIAFQLHPKAISFIQSYMEKQGPALLKMKTWAKPYFNLYDQILIANGVPVQLKYLSVIESSLNAGVVSWAGAAGPWQIMPAEAQALGLKLFPIDQRMDYEKSTQAAATILRNSFTEFKDWLLVVAAYNGGAGRVREAIKKKGTKDFWEIQYELPLETRNHVKKFIATQYIFESEGNRVDLTGQSAIPIYKETVHKERNITTISISGRFQIAIIAKHLEMDWKELSLMNPGFDKMVASGKTYLLKLPEGMVKKFEARKNEILQASINSLYKVN